MTPVCIATAEVSYHHLRDGTLTARADQVGGIHGTLIDIFHRLEDNGNPP
jgi:hypothetical protein